MRLADFYTAALALAEITQDQLFLLKEIGAVVHHARIEHRPVMWCIDPHQVDDAITALVFLKAALSAGIKLVAYWPEYQGGTAGLNSPKIE